MLFLAWSPASASASPASNAVAVADFEALDGEPDSRDWAFGLADMLAAELQRRGVSLFERGQIRLILAERGIATSGLMGLHEIQSQEIPAVQYIVTGNIRSITKQEFHLQASLADARSGRSVASFVRQGRCPEDLPGALAALAGEIAGHSTLAPTLIAVTRSTAPGHARTPEVALLLYKGISYCLAGQPQLGVTWFMEAQRADPYFLAARVWTLRAFQMIGISELVAAARQNVLDSPTGMEVLNRIEGSHLLETGLVSIAVIPDPRLDRGGLLFHNALRTELQSHTNLFVSDPSNIRALAAEMDLQLSEKGVNDLDLTTVLWTAVDDLVFVRPGQSKEDLEIELRDGVSGEPLSRTRVPRDVSQSVVVGRNLEKQISAHQRGTLPENRLADAQPAEPGWPVHSFDSTDRKQFAALLMYVAENPANRSALEFLVQNGPWLDSGFRIALYDRLLKFIDPNDPDAAALISDVLWHRRYQQSHNPLAQQDTSPSVAKDFALLLDRYPNSLPAQYVRSTLAMEYVNHHKYAEAVPIFLKLADELPREAPEGLIRPEYWANFNFFTGAALYELGDVARSRQFLARAEEILRKNAGLARRQISTGLFYYRIQGKPQWRWGNHFPAFHPLFGAGRNLDEAVAEWSARLATNGQQSAAQPLTLARLEALLAEANEAQSKEALIKSREFLRQLVEHKQQNPALYRGPITDYDPKAPQRAIHWGKARMFGNYTRIGKLVMEAMVKLNVLAAEAYSTKELEDVRRLAHDFVDGLDAGIAADCLEAVGEYEQALPLVDKCLNNPTPLTYAATPGTDEAEVHLRHENLSLIRQKVRLLMRLGKPEAAAVYARSQIPRVDTQVKLEVAKEAADAFARAGHVDQSCLLFSELARGDWRDEPAENGRCSSLFLQADYEVARGNLFEASELLREVIKQSEGKRWHIRARHARGDIYEDALARLAEVRSLARVRIASMDWENDGEFERFRAIPSKIDSEPAVATPSEAPQVLEAFKKTPNLAEAAFRLDADRATIILRERFAIYWRGDIIPQELWRVIENYRLKDQYPVLIANLVDEDANRGFNARNLDRILHNDPAPELLERFREALAFGIERQLLRKRQYGLATLGDVALQNGAKEGIEAILRAEELSPTEALGRLRKSIDLPTDDVQARAIIESNRGRWRWDPDTGKFVAPTN